MGVPVTERLSDRFGLYAHGATTAIPLVGVLLGRWVAVNVGLLLVVESVVTVATGLVAFGFTYQHSSTADLDPMWTWLQLYGVAVFIGGTIMFKLLDSAPQSSLPPEFGLAVVGIVVGNLAVVFTVRRNRSRAASDGTVLLQLWSGAVPGVAMCVLALLLIPLSGGGRTVGSYTTALVVSVLVCKLVAELYFEWLDRNDVMADD